MTADATKRTRRKSWCSQLHTDGSGKRAGLLGALGTRRKLTFARGSQPGRSRVVAQASGGVQLEAPTVTTNAVRSTSSHDGDRKVHPQRDNHAFTGAF